MSTKAIREALDAAATAAPDTNNEALARKVSAAWSEVEAIEKAAQRRAALAEAIAEGDTAALERLAQMAYDEANSLPSGPS